jgi:hypothetical protein
MNDLLRRHLSPDDDGRAFTEAVLLRAAGALHRRRASRARSDGPAWVTLEAWARPWLVAAIVGLALAIAVPELWHQAPEAAAEPSLTADLMGATTGTSYVLAETLGN